MSRYYVGLDVHKASICIAVLNASGKLAQLLRAGLLSAVCHGQHGTRDLKELVRSYEYLVEDSTRVMNRIKALFRSRAIACAGTDVYKPGRREGWLAKLPGAGVQARAQRLFSELDHLTGLRREARQALVAECRRHPASRLLIWQVEGWLPKKSADAAGVGEVLS